MAEIKEILKTTQTKMHKTVDVLRVDLASVRAGRASVSLLDKVMVEYYGTPTPVNQVASVTVPEPRMIIIQPWEKNLLKDIERAIMKSDLGLNPNSDGSVIRLNLPQLTEERRKELVKTVHKKAEDARVSVRNLRRDANDAVKKAEKAKEITEDEAKRYRYGTQGKRGYGNLMGFPDVLALEVSEALRILKQAGYTCEVTATEPPKSKGVPQEGSITEYVVRQRELDNNKAEIITVRRYRKGGVQDGSENQ